MDSKCAQKTVLIGKCHDTALVTVPLGLFGLKASTHWGVTVTNFSLPLLVDGKLLPKPELHSPTVT